MKKKLRLVLWLLLATSLTQVENLRELSPNLCPFNPRDRNHQSCNNRDTGEQLVTEPNFIPHRKSSQGNAQLHAIAGQTVCSLNHERITVHSQEFIFARFCHLVCWNSQIKASFHLQLKLLQTRSVCRKLLQESKFLSNLDKIICNSMTTLELT